MSEPEIDTSDKPKDRQRRGSSPRTVRDGDRVDWSALGVPPMIAVYHQGGTLFALWDGEKHILLDLDGMSWADSRRAVSHALTLMDMSKPLYTNRAARRAVDKRLDS